MTISCGGFNFLWVIDHFVVLLKAINLLLEKVNTYNIWPTVSWDPCIPEASPWIPGSESLLRKLYPGNLQSLPNLTMNKLLSLLTVF